MTNNKKNIMTNKTLVFIPTYNEKENAPKLCEEILALPLAVDVLFMDDASPDGTGRLLDEIALKNTRVHVVHRKGKLGIGSAHFDGIQWAYEHQYTGLVTMDCDFTHPPSYIPGIIQMGEKTDVVVGSRFLQKNSLSEWNLFRKSLTTLGHLLTRTLLNLKYDATGGFRFYNLEKVPRSVFDLVQSRGYSFLFESLFILNFNKITISELPINLPARTYGHSKMDLSEVKKSLSFLFKTFFTSVFNPEKFQISQPLAKDAIDNSKKDEQGWDGYWQNRKASSGGMLYDAIAAFYRKFIIRPSLNSFVRTYFQPGAQVLHAGCGSGQVDVDIRDYVSITGLDLSVNALNFYQRTNQDRCKVLHGSIFDIPLASGTVDGIYNLGVMEHFTPDEITKIMSEFHRVLKPHGRMVIFWPPEFGASVIFLKGVKWTLENVFGKKNVKIHPDEITRVQSKKSVVELFEASGFKVLQYYFGPKDLFTYSVIAVEKKESALMAKPMRSLSSANQSSSSITAQS